MWNIFTVNNEDTRMTPAVSFWCPYCSLWTYLTPCSSVSIANFERWMPAGYPVTYSELCKTFMMELCAKIVNSWKWPGIFAKYFILHVWQGSEKAFYYLSRLFTLEWRFEEISVGSKLTRFSLEGFLDYWKQWFADKSA